jgi:predicted transposase YbfD/YdcC
MVKAWRIRDDVVSHERGYYISSFGLDANQRAEGVRGHGAVENAHHWEIYLVFRADDCGIRKGHAPENCALLRDMALSLPKPEKTNRHGMKVKSDHACGDNDD